jgi:hypothetical protein
VFVAGAAVIAVAGIAGVVVAHTAFDVQIFHSTGDPNAVLDFPAWVGWFSHLGVLLWIGGAAAALMAAVVLEPGTERRRFLLVLGLFTAWLGADDLYWIHEAVGRALVGGEAGEDIVFAVYVLMMLAILWRFRRLIVVETPVTVLALSGMFFALSVVIDRPVPATSGAQYLLEDGAKFTGITLLAVYLVLTGRRFIMAERGSPAAPPSRAGGLSSKGAAGGATGRGSARG